MARSTRITEPSSETNQAALAVSYLRVSTKE